MAIVAISCIKGIKRHIAVDSHGLPLSVTVTTANVHDSKAAYPLIAQLAAHYESITSIKADNGYKGRLPESIQDILSTAASMTRMAFLVVLLKHILPFLTLTFQLIQSPMYADG